METIVTETMAVPPPEPERPPAAGPGDWVRRNLFRSPGRRASSRSCRRPSSSTSSTGPFATWSSTGRWEIVRVNLKLFMVGRYPNDELWRISVAIALIAFFTALVAGFIGRRRVVTGRAEPDAGGPWWRTTLATIGTAVAAHLRRRPRCCR